jgi:hypothetical protein
LIAQTEIDEDDVGIDVSRLLQINAAVAACNHPEVRPVTEERGHSFAQEPGVFDD